MENAPQIPNFQPKCHEFFNKYSKVSDERLRMQFSARNSVVPTKIKFAVENDENARSSKNFNSISTYTTYFS